MNWERNEEYLNLIIMCKNGRVHWGFSKDFKADLKLGEIDRIDSHATKKLALFNLKTNASCSLIDNNNVIREQPFPENSPKSHKTKLFLWSFGIPR